MRGYYVFLLDENGRIFTRVDLVASDDDDAISKASQTEAPHGIELWCEQRLVWSGKPSPVFDFTSILTEQPVFG